MNPLLNQLGGILGNKGFWTAFGPVGVRGIAKLLKCSDADAWHYWGYAQSFFVGLHLSGSSNGQPRPATDNNDQPKEPAPGTFTPIVTPAPPPAKGPTP